MTDENPMDTYTKFTRMTAVYPENQALEYLALGLTSEAGEVAGKMKKWIRGDAGIDIRAAILAELGDVLWYLTRLADELDSSLAAVMAENTEKLTQRKMNNTLRGDGDDR